MSLPQAAIDMTDYEVNYYYDGDDIYVCQAKPGNTDSSLAYWRIKKIKDHNIEPGPTSERWANGQNDFKYVADDYASHTYANEP